MNKCKNENCSSEQLITNYKESPYCESHACIFKNCEREIFLDFLTCESHTCLTCNQSHDYLENNGLELCMRCYKKYIRYQQLKFTIAMFAFICINYVYNLITS